MELKDCVSVIDDAGVLHEVEASKENKSKCRRTVLEDGTLLRLHNMMSMVDNPKKEPDTVASSKQQTSRPSFWRLLQLSKPEWPILGVAILLAVLCIGVDLVTPELKKVMDNIVVYPFFAKADLYGLGIVTLDIGSNKGLEIRRFTMYSLLVRAISAALGTVKAIIFGLVAERVVTRMRLKLFHAILRQEMGFFDMRTSGELSSRLGPDAAAIQMVATTGVPDLVVNGIKIVLASVMMFSQSWELGLMVLGLIPLTVAYMIPFMPSVIRLNKNYQDALATTSNIATQSISNVRVVRSFGGEAFACALYAYAVGDPKLPSACCWWPPKTKTVYRVEVVRAVIQQLMIQGTITVASIGITFIQWYGYVMVTESEIDFGSYGAFMTYAMIIGIHSGLIMKAGFGVFNAMGASQRIFEIIDRKPDIQCNVGETIPPGISGEVTFDNVSFSYPSRPDVQILSNLSFKTLAKSKTAFVGGSGAGKSTILALLERLYDPSEGKVLLDGYDLRQLDAGWLRRRIGVVQQEPVLFGFSITENIRFGRTAACVSERLPDVSDEDVIEAAQVANAHEFISAFPDGYETLVGERGVRLSGGQKQRIAIARTVLCNPSVMLLDEATSALDSESEHVVQEALDRLMANRTVLVVAHRLSTIVNADQILMMTKDGILGAGRHEELLRTCEAYKDLVQHQIVRAGPESEKHSGVVHEDEAVQPLAEADESNKPQEKVPDERKECMVLQSHASCRNLDASSLERIVMMTNAVADKKKEKAEQGDQEKDGSEASRDAKNKSICPFFWMLIKPEFPVLVGTIIVTMASAGIEAWLPLLQGDIVDVVVGSASVQHKKDEVRRIMIILLIVSGAVQAVHYSRVVVCSMAGGRFVARLRLRILSAIFNQELAFFDTHTTGSLTSRLTSDTALVQAAAGMSVVEVCYGSLKAGAALVMAFNACWQLALMTLAVFPAMGLVLCLPLGWLMKLHTKYNDALARSTHVATEATGSMKTVISYGSEDFVELLYGASVGRLDSWWPNKSQSMYRHGVRRAVMIRVSLQLALWIGASLVTLIMWYAYHRILQGSLTFGEVMSFVMFSMNITQGLASVSGGIGGVVAAVAALKRIFEIDSRKPAMPITGGKQPLDFEMDVKFENVSFSYPSRPDVQVLSGLSFTVPANSTAAFVGSSGSGKSTVLALLERLYDVNAGRVVIGGHDVANLDASWLRQQIGIVQQEPLLFGISVRENIAYGRNAQRAFGRGSDVSDEEILKVSEVANAHQFVSSFPDGYETLVGERGILLSGGQKQRIAIARALLTEPRILLLDEATSALDAESEHLVQEAIDRAMENRTVLVVAHRLSTVRDADQIHVMAKGTLIDSGTHDELVDRCDCYHMLIKHQMSMPPL